MDTMTLLGLAAGSAFAGLALWKLKGKKGIQVIVAVMWAVGMLTFILGLVNG